MRRIAAQHPAFGRVTLVRGDRGALARDDQNELRSVFGGAPKEMIEPAMRLRLGQSVQIKDVVNLAPCRRSGDA